MTQSRCLQIHCRNQVGTLSASILRIQNILSNSSFFLEMISALQSWRKLSGWCTKALQIVVSLPPRHSFSICAWAGGVQMGKGTEWIITRCSCMMHFGSNIIWQVQHKWNKHFLFLFATILSYLSSRQLCCLSFKACVMETDTISGLWCLERTLSSHYSHVNYYLIMWNYLLILQA